MKNTLKYFTQKCYYDYKNDFDFFKTWLFDNYPAQAITTVTSIKW